MSKINNLELKEIFSGMRDNNKSAIEKLYANYNKLVYRIAFGILKNNQDAEDVVSIVFEKIYKMNTEKLPVSNESSWLYSVTKNESINLYKSKQNYQSLDEIYEIKSENNEINNIINQMEYNNLINKLSAEEQEIVSLKILSNITFEEISKLLNKPTGTVKWKYYKSINKLKIILSNLGMFIVTFAIGIKTLFQNKKNVIEKSDTVQNTTIEDNTKTVTQELQDTNNTSKSLNNIILEDSNSNTQEETEQIVNQDTLNIKNYVGISFLILSFVFFIISLIFLLKHQLKTKKRLSK